MSWRLCMRLTMLQVDDADSPRESTGTDRNASHRSSGSSLNVWKRGSLKALRPTATGWRCSATQPVIPCPTRILRRSITSGCGVFDARRTRSSSSTHEARVARHHTRHEIDDAPEHAVKRIRRGDAAADLVQDVDIRLVLGVGIAVEVVGRHYGSNPDCVCAHEWPPLAPRASPAPNNAPGMNRRQPV